MVSTEQLRRYAFFSGCTPAQLDSIALISQVVSLREGEAFFETDAPAGALYILLEGGADLHYTASDERTGKTLKDFFVHDIGIGEPFGISALISPNRYVGTVRAGTSSRAIKVDAEGLRALCEGDAGLEILLLRRTLQATMARLHDTRLLLIGGAPAGE